MKAYSLWPLVFSLCVPSLRAQSNCTETDKTTIGTANQGGYLFNYQSGKGKDCRTYRLRNTPGKLLTPALWQDDKEVFLDVTLPECQTSSKECPWTEAVKISASEITQGNTVLSYGANKDQYKDEPDAYRKNPGKEQLPSFLTILRGTIADLEKKPHTIAVQVFSSAEFRTDAKSYVLAYRVVLLEPSEPLLLVQPIAGAKPGLRLLWESAASGAFFQQLQERKITALSPDVREFGIEIRTKDITVEEFKLLSIFQGKERIAATSAPAYVPKE